MQFFKISEYKIHLFVYIISYMYSTAKTKCLHKYYLLIICSLLYLTICSNSFNLLLFMHIFLNYTFYLPVSIYIMED